MELTELEKAKITYKNMQLIRESRLSMRPEIEIDWNRRSCNTCTRGLIHSNFYRGVGWSMLLKSKPRPTLAGCQVSKRCGRAFSEHLSHKKFKGKVKNDMS